MEWLEIKIETTTESVETVAAMLYDVGITGIQIEDDADLKTFLETNSTEWDYVDDALLNKTCEAPKIILYVSDNEYGRDLFINVKNGLTQLKTMDLGIDVGTLAVTVTNMDDEDWLNNWKKYYKPFPIGEKILIKPFWEEAANEENRIVLNINPGNVFGTGLHQTTQLCIVELEKHVRPDTTLLDLGCGSGILSIVSLLLGAKCAFAVDIDPNAVQTAYDNAALNHVDTKAYTVVSGNVLTDTALQDKIGYGQYDIVVANIVADVIIGLSPLVKTHLKPGGYFISSGIISERVEDVYKALAENGFSVLDTFYKDDWICVLSTNRSDG